MRKTGAWLLLVAVALAIACIPAWNMANEHLTITTGRHIGLPPENVHVEYAPVEGWGGLIDQYNYAYDLPETYETYRIDCGTPLDVNDPPTVTLTGSTTERVHLTSFDGSRSRLTEVHSHEEAMARITGMFLSEDPMPVAADYQRWCSEDMVARRIWAFLASPLGWVVIGVVGLVALSMFAGGGGGWTGSATPNLMGGWTIRLWR
jgi:hypothetical protein